MKSCFSKVLFGASASWVSFYKQGMLRTIHLLRGTCKEQVVRMRACDIMEAEIMKYHVLSWSAGKVLAEDQNQDQDQAQLFYGYSLTKASENN